MSSGDKKLEESCYAGRDAFHGIPLWNVKNGYIFSGKQVQFMAASDRAYTSLQKRGPLVALDAATGEPVLIYDEACRLSEDPSLTAIRYCRSLPHPVA